MAQVHGTAAPGFEPVREAFVRNFDDYGEVGAACAVYFRGTKVVDLWGGYSDVATRTPWAENTMVPVFSTTKGMSALAVALAHSRGWLDYEAKVCTYWPEFAVAGKESVTVRQLLGHQAGLSAVDKTLDLATLADLDRLADILAGQAPSWQPGTRHGYHCWTLGFYINELIRRTDPQHRSLGRFFADEIARPLGLHFYIGLPDSVPNDHLATLIPPSVLKVILGMKHPLALITQMARPGSLFYRTAMNPPVMRKHANLNRRDVLAVEVGSGNGVGDARSIARAYSAFATGGAELGLKPETIAALSAAPVLPTGGTTDMVWLQEMRYSLGFIKPIPAHPFGSARAFGHSGAGGSLGFADPQTQVAYGYVMNRMDSGFYVSRCDHALRRALNQCLEQKVAEAVPGA